MKHIRKGSEPQALRAWRDGQPVVNGRRVNCGYGDMPSDVKQSVRASLLIEQGYLCCYTGRSVDETSSHIEHLKPQTVCEDGEDIDYANLLIAYPGGSLVAPYGAQAKADWYDPQLLVSPLHAGCETRFKFSQFGGIAPASDQDQGAIETIRQLHLDHDELNDSRKQIIQKTLIKLKPSKKQLETISDSYCNLNSERRFKSYCFVIQQVARTLLKKSENQMLSQIQRNKTKKSKRKPQ
ncbi:MAG TPA: TIGR02646 family protein [Aggregatilineales bacterium]|nr:TIGR02646 family protein [Aggregatilineales bacterium]